MPAPKPHEFKTRVSPDLWAIIVKETRREGKTLNGQINEWLWAMAKPDDAARLADALRPVLESLNETDRDAFMKHAISAIKALATGMPKAGRTKRKRTPPVPSSTDE